MLSFFSSSASFIVQPLPVPTTQVQPAANIVNLKKYTEQATNIFPTTVLLADESYAAPLKDNQFGMPTKSGDLYTGGASTLDLASILDEIPMSDLDPKGQAGIEADEDGVDRLLQRQAEKEARDAADFQWKLEHGKLD